MMQIYSIFDRKTAAYMQPFFALTDGAALRTVMSSMGEGSMFKAYPGDFDVFRLGRFDEGSGEISSAVDFLVNVANLVTINEEV